MNGQPSRTRRRTRDEGRAIVEAMRRGDAGAFTAYVEHYQRLLLHYGRKADLRDEDAEDLAQTVLGDVAVELLARGARMPPSVALLLIGRFRSRLLNMERDGERRARRVSEASTDLDWMDDEQDSRVALFSENALRASHGPDWEPPPASAGLSALSRMLSQSLTDEERQMLAWESEDVPQREIAERLGISHAAVRQRLKRLKERLRSAAERYAAGLEGDSGRVVRRFLRRSLDAPRAASPPGTGEGARRRRATPGPLADGSGHEPRARGEGGPNDA